MNLQKQSLGDSLQQIKLNKMFDYVKAVLNLGFSIFVAIYLLITMNDLLSTMNTKQEIQIQTLKAIETMLNKVYERQLTK